jgi:hypothetical protein
MGGLAGEFDAQLQVVMLLYVSTLEGAVWGGYGVAGDMVDFQNGCYSI